MGITHPDCTLLFHARKLGVNYSHTCMLGRLQLYATQDQIQSSIQHFGTNEKKIDEVSFIDEYSEPLFEILGAQKVDSIDFSDYENATIIHDLNNPLPANLKGTFSCMLDWGTIEHIFNFPTAIKTCMESIRIGGHYIGVSPANNQMGHGFYQFSPELYYRIFSEENGFRILTMLISVDNDENTIWYEVADPKNVKSRVMLTNSYPVSLRFIAEKIADKEIFKTIPQQSDYINAWDAHQSLSKGEARGSESKLRFYYRKLMPYRVKVILQNLYRIYRDEKQQTPDLGTINPEHFRRVEM
jgi:hypothetical protein